MNKARMASPTMGREAIERYDRLASLFYRVQRMSFSSHTLVLNELLSIEQAKVKE